MILFEVNNEKITDDDFSLTLEKFELKNKSVLLYSRLLTLGRCKGERAAIRILRLFQEHIGPNGCLCLPCYTFSAYRNEVFDLDSKSLVGVLAEVGRQLPDFVRTIHPVYSNICWGHNTDQLSRQNYHSCFGDDSFFDIFTTLPNPYIMMLGTNFSAATIYHYYDQTYGTLGRYKKNFKARITIDGNVKHIKFDSYVKLHSFFRNRKNCLGFFDALATQLGLVKRVRLGGHCLVGINENSFHILYSICARRDPLYFVYSTVQNWEQYYQMNKYELFQHQLDSIKANEISKLFNDRVTPQ